MLRGWCGRRASGLLQRSPESGERGRRGGSGGGSRRGCFVRTVGGGLSRGARDRARVDVGGVCVVVVCEDGLDLGGGAGGVAALRGGPLRYVIETLSPVRKPTPCFVWGGGVLPLGSQFGERTAWAPMLR